MNRATQERNNVSLNPRQMYENIIGEGNDVELVVRRLITSLGFKSKLLGTKYLEHAILYRYNNASNFRVGMTNSAYVDVANRCNSTANRVERAIRNSIINCYEHGALIRFNDLAQAPIIRVEFAPSNGEFMSSVVNWLQLEKHSGRIK